MSASLSRKAAFLILEWIKEEELIAKRSFSEYRGRWPNREGPFWNDEIWKRASPHVFKLVVKSKAMVKALLQRPPFDPAHEELG